MKRILLLLLVPVLWACLSGKKENVDPESGSLAGTNWKGDQYKIFIEPATDGTFYKMPGPEVNMTWDWTFIDEGKGTWTSSRPPSGSFTYVYDGNKINLVDSMGNKREIDVKLATKTQLHLVFHTNSKPDKSGYTITEELILILQ